MRKFACAYVSILAVGWSLAAPPAVAADHTLRAGKPEGETAWHPSTVTVKKDDVVIVSQADNNMDHGFVFTEQDTIPPCGTGAPPPGTKFCEVIEAGRQSGYNRPIQAGQTGPFLRIRVLEDLSTEQTFRCVVHGANMAGKLKK